MSNDVADLMRLQAAGLASKDSVSSLYLIPADAMAVRSGQRSYRIAKRAFDVVGAGFGLIILSPVMLLVAVAIACTDGFPVLYRQKRVGSGMKPFQIFKFRSMRVDADEILRRDPELMKQFQINFKLENDPRITAIGKFIRKTSLDELPQLYNVLRGEMSLVGPRPIVEKEIELYGDGAWVFCAVEPGCTGLWQCSGRSALTYEARVALDVQYVKTASLWGDLTIILKTITSVVKRHGAH
jgi:lipopolysaccharide/colanic/teichoic acid biosynthesis glycosyltransferase